MAIFCCMTLLWSCANSRATLCFPVGNILTLADDLLKNDGQKFLEMMEQLAERRMQREQQAAQDLEEDSDADDDEDGDSGDFLFVGRTCSSGLGGLVEAFCASG